MNYTSLKNGSGGWWRLLPLAVLTLLATAVPSRAAVYEWVDEKGVVSFTDSRDKIPEKYRGSAREKVLPPVKPAPGANTVAPVKAEPRPAASPRQSEQLYAGRTLAWWRGRQAELQVKIRAVENELAEQRDESVKLHRKRTLYQKGSDRAQYNELKKEVEDSEKELKALQEQLIKLQSDAAAAGVPLQ